MHKVKIVMLFLQMFVSNILIVLVDAVSNYRELTFKERITPLYYKLEVMLPNYIEQNIAIDGESRITIRIEENIQQLSFQSFAHIQEATLHKINPYNVTIREPYVRKHLVATYKPRKPYQSKDSGRIREGFVNLFFDKTIECGYYVLEVIFFTQVTNRETDGFILTSYRNLKELQWMIATQTREKPQAVFPCWNNPHFKIVFDVSVRHRTNYMAFSNSKIHNFESDRSNVRMWTHFESTPPIPVHCINIVVLPISHDSYFTYVDLDNNVTMWTPSHLISSQNPYYDFAWNITKEVTKYLKEQNLIDQCKVAETNYIALDSLSHTILATPSFVLYSAETVEMNEWIYKNDYKDRRKLYVAHLIAQQITDQWILRSTNPLYWPFSELKDVLNFLTMCILQKVLPNFNVAFWKSESKFNHFFYISYIEYLHATSFILDENDIIKFIISTRTNILCDSNEEELSLESIFN